MGCAEVFKDKGFLFKFVICIVIIVLAIMFSGIPGFNAYSWALLAGGVFLFSSLECFFPVFIMMILYATKGFNDHLYEFVIDVFGAVAGLLAGIFLLLFNYAREDTRPSRDEWMETAANPEYSNYDEYPSQRYYGYEADPYVTVAAALSIALMALYIVDAIFNGLKGLGKSAAVVE